MEETQVAKPTEVIQMNPQRKNTAVRRYGLAKVQGMFARFKITPQEFENDERWGWAIGKFLDDDVFISKQKIEIGRLKRKTNALLDRISKGAAIPNLKDGK